MYKKGDGLSRNGTRSLPIQIVSISSKCWGGDSRKEFSGKEEGCGGLF
jgi:hypothetical protein